ncbi:MAG: type sorting protein [Flavipsychrobacter sp.]|jgi:hypothetical protein|nr:type sorting protein [Flavipsychrobacter sp.]
MKNSLLSLVFALGIVSNAHSQCSTPTGLTTSYANNVTTFSWTPVSGATSYDFELKQSWDGWAEWYDTAPTHTYTLTGIMHSISIDWRVKAVCPSGSSGYQTFSNFVVPCPQPSALTTTSVTMTGATINWTAAAGYNTYVSDFTTSYRKSGTTTWTYLGNTSGTSKTITGLQANTTYEWRVAQTCPYFNSSYVTSSFTTLACNSAGANSTEWISRFKLGSVDRSSGAESGGYVNVTSSTINLTAGTSNQAKIRVGYNGSFTNKVFKVYIDYNNNTIYEETEVVYGPSSITGSGLQTFYISISSTAPNGVHGMRVIMARNGTTITGCMSGHNGETEDYKVNISGGAKGISTAPAEIAEVEKINVYPNPATSIMNIQLPDGVSVINVYDIMGKKVFQQPASAITMEINVAQWPVAQYIVEAIYADGHKDVTRFVKQ